MGFPPKELALDIDKVVGDYINTGEVLTISKSETPKSIEVIDVDHTEEKSVSGTARRISVPDDNSCLFNAVSYCFENQSFDMASTLREICSSIILSDPDTYNEATLGRKNQEYAEWIAKPNSWGGAIEVSILSAYYEAEIFVFETANSMQSCFGEDKGYSKRIYLIYDGIHYDTLVTVERSQGKEHITTIFSPGDDAVKSKFEQLNINEKLSGKYTDTANFTLRCAICSKSL